MQPLDSNRWMHLSALLDHAWDLSSEARDAWLDAWDVRDAETAAALRRLLGYAMRNSGIDGSRTDRTEFSELLRDALTEEMSAALAIDQHFGPWRTTALLGEGGMGAVYLAERDLDGSMQRGALKLVKRGMDSVEVLARFRRERQILVRLAHPCIAPLLDGGLADDGRPYLVMGYVVGEPLDQWSGRSEIGLEARCALILQLCDAVAHAHRLLIVHRDIKPGNVLVDAQGAPYLLDFGIAKLLEDTDDASRTTTATRFLTRAYAAPEQISGGAISTSVDVFQLGVLLFELLSGERFHESSAAITGKPSQRLASAREHSAERGPAAITPRVLRGDAGIIVARATDADPARRYATVEAFAEDIRRWRSGLPIRARADSTRYRLAKFARRHAFGIAAAAIALIALFTTTGLALWQAQRAEAQGKIAQERAQTAERVKQFMVGLFQAPDPSQAKGAMPRADELLDRGAAQIATELAGQPRVQAELYEAMATSYMGLGQFDTGADLLKRAVTGLGDAPENAALSARQERVRAAALAELGHYSEALAALDHAIAARQRVAEPDTRESARIESIRGWVMRDLGRYADSETALRHALELAQASSDDMNPAALGALNNLAYTLQLAGKKQESIATYERVTNWFAAHVSQDQSPRLWAEYTFAKSLRALGEPVRARELLERIRPTMLKVVGEKHADLAGLDIALGQARMDLDDGGGFDLIVDAVDRSHRATPQKNMLWASAEFALAESYQRTARTEQAERHFRAAREVYVALIGIDNPDVREVDRRLAELAASRSN